MSNDSDYKKEMMKDAALRASFLELDVDALPESGKSKEYDSTRFQNLELDGREFPNEDHKQQPKPTTVETKLYEKRFGAQREPQPQIDLSHYQPQEVFILKYDDFGIELTRKVNEIFRGTKAEVPTSLPNQEIPRGNILVRSAYLTTIVNNQELRSLGAYPITPLQSEALLQQNRLPKDPTKYWEDLALILYDDQGANSREAQALKESIRQHQKELNLSDLDLEQRLLVVNSGLELDPSSKYGVKPVVIEGITKVFVHETLNRTGNNKFNYGSENGLPSTSELGTGDRTLWMPSQNNNPGLRVLVRGGGLNLGARGEYLDYSYVVGRVSFAKNSP